MSTVDYETALAVAEGKYQDDGVESIIIYCNMFGSISFKLCYESHPGATASTMEYMEQAGWMPEVVWLARFPPMTAWEFTRGVEDYCRLHPNKVMN